MIVMNGEDNDQLRQEGGGRQPQQEKTPILAYKNGVTSGSRRGSDESDQHTNVNPLTVTHTESELSSSSEFNDIAVNISGSEIDAGNNEDKNGDDDEDDIHSSDRDIDQQEKDANDRSDGEEEDTAASIAQPPSATVATNLSPSSVPISATTAPSTTTSNIGSSSSNNINNQNRGVRFGNITIHELPIIVGDNPAVSVGPPVTVDWMPTGSSSWSNGGHIDDYENTNGTYAAAIVVSVDDYDKQRPVPRNRSQLRMPSSYRTELLRRQGFSRREIMEGSKQAAVVRHRRKRTIELWHFAPAIEAVERVRRGILNVTVKRAAKVAERQMLSKYVVLDVDGIDGVPPPPPPATSDSISEDRSSSSITSSSRSKTTNRYVRNSICLKSKDSIEMLQGRSTPFTEAGSSFVLTQQQ